jgi:hypothetical protein
MRLYSIAGNVSWFSVFQPQHFLSLGFRFLYFVNFIDVIFAFTLQDHFRRFGSINNTFHVATFKASNGIPIIKLLFRKESEHIQTFIIGPFTFKLLGTELALVFCR